MSINRARQAVLGFAPAGRMDFAGPELHRPRGEEDERLIHLGELPPRLFSEVCLDLERLRKERPFSFNG